MDIERRAFLTSASALLAASAAGAQEYKNPALVAAEPGAPPWPLKERFALWPGTPPGAPHPLPAPGWQMFPDGPQLWIKGIASPEVNVIRPALPDGSAILVTPGEAHFFAGGGHGFGLHLPKAMPDSRWPDLFALWMRKHGG